MRIEIYHLEPILNSVASKSKKKNVNHETSTKSEETKKRTGNPL